MLADTLERNVRKPRATKAGLKFVNFVKKKKKKVKQDLELVLKEMDYKEQQRIGRWG